ncbi:hypothetical protein [Rhodobacter capsulatus]|uniref:hypothetical protein n=1 Tax=Rhodobacter capsulatus TaxID=1061 RepID=UPI0040282C37
MTFFSSAALDAAPVGATPALRVSTNYMETFLPLQPVSSGTEIQTYLNTAGMLDIYSVGTTGRVYRYRRTDATLAPYEEADLGIRASQLYFFDAAGGRSDTPSIFGLNSDSKLTLATFQSGGYGQRNTGPQDEVIRTFLGVRGVTGRIYINVRLSDGRLCTNYYDPLNDKWGGPVWAPVIGPDGKEAVVKDIAMAANNPVQSAIFAIGMDDEVLFAEDSFRTSHMRKLNKKASHIAAIADADNLLNILAVERDTGLLWVKKQRKRSTSGIQFDDWVQVDPGQSGRLGRLTANLRRDGLIEVFVLNEAGDLSYTRQVTNSAGKLQGWRVIFPLARAMENRIVAVGRNANGYSEAYSVTEDNQIFRFWQAPDTEQWFSEVLDLPKAEDKLVSMPTHSTEIFVVDAEGAPLYDAPVSINAAFLCTLWVNGEAYRSSLVDPVSFRTDATGKVVILQRANALAGATLLISTPVTGAGQPIVVQPNGQLQAKMAQTTKEDVLTATDSAGALLLPADTKDRENVAESIAEVTRQSMRIAQADETARAIQYKFATPHALRHSLQADFRSLGTVSWEIDFGSGVPVYRSLDSSDIAAFRAAHAPQLDAGGSFLGIDWGSVWRGIRDGVEWLINGLEKIVVTIVDGIANVLFKIAGQVFQAVIKFAQQALDFIEGVWNWLKVKLEQLFQWLAFLFDFKDFGRTAEGIKHCVGVTLDFTADAVHALRGRVEEGFEFLKAGLDGIVNNLILTLNREGDPTMGAYFEQEEPSEEEQHASDHNIFLNAFRENESKLTVKADGAAILRATTALSDPLQDLFGRMKSFSDNFQFGDGKQALDEAFGYFNNIGNEPGRAAQLLLSGLVKALEAAALFALDAAEGIVLTLFDLVEDLIRLVKLALFQEWEIPILSQLYKLFTGDRLTLTPIDVVAWIAAIPMTITSKLVLGRTPWTAEQLAVFKASFTVEMLKDRLGMSRAKALTAAEANGWTPEWRENFLTGYCVVMAFRSLLDPSSAMANATGKGLGEAGIVPVAAGFLSTLFTMPWALSPLAGAPNCQPGDPGFGVTIWICQVLCGPGRGIALHYQKWITGEAKITTGELTQTAWGVAYLIMLSVHFANQEQTTRNKLAFSRGILNLVPGQALRFLAIPALNKSTYMIPAAVLGVLSFLSCWGSLGVAIAEIHLKDQAQV